MRGIKEKTTGLKRIQLWVKVLIVILILFTSIPVQNLKQVSANTSNSNDRRMGLVELGRSRHNSEGIGDNLETLTGEQLKVIGVFLSNFYVPFSTQIGSGRTSEETEEIKNQMILTLTETGSFGMNFAEAIVEAVLGVSNNPQPLYMAYSTDGGDSYSPAKLNGSEGRPATFYEFLDHLSGYPYKNVGTANMRNPYPDKDAFDDLDDAVVFGEKGLKSIYSDPNYGYVEGSNNRGALYWGANGVLDESNIVFDWNPDVAFKGKQTPSQTVMATIYKYLDVDNSIATSFLDYTDEERGSKKQTEVLGSLVKDLELEGTSVQSIYQRSMFDWTMWVDAFGNILVDTGVRQYVVVPAAMNPFVFNTDGTNVDTTEFTFGDNVPINNLMSLTLASKGDLISKYSSGESMDFNVGTINSELPDSGVNGLKAFYIVPGASQTNFDEGGRDWGAVLLDTTLTQWAKKMHNKNDEWYSGQEWLNLGSKPGDTDRQTGTSLENGFTYGFQAAQTGSKDYLIAPRSGLKEKATHFVIQNLVAFDTFGLLNSDNYATQDLDLETILPVPIFDDDGTPVIDLTSVVDTGSAFGQKLEAKRNSLHTYSNQIIRDYMANIYVTYVLAGLGSSDVVGFQIGFNNFPPFNAQTVLNDTSASSVEEQFLRNSQEVMNMSYYFLHPTEGVEYFARWFKTKVGGALVGWHNDMVGANDSSYTTGMTRYVGFSGYTTMPSLTDMEWTSWMVNSYLNWGIYLIIIVIVIMLLYIVIGDISFQRAILGVGIFTLCLYLPPTAINSVVGFTNSVSDSIYSSKFMHWGVTQLQTYSGKIDELAKAGEDGDRLDYSKSLMSLQGTDGLYGNNQGIGNGVTLKWMTPKKDNYLGQIKEEISNSVEGNTVALDLLTDGILRRTLSGETYLESQNAVYLYRTFTDITNYSRFYYGNLMGDNVYNNGTQSHDIGSIAKAMGDIGLGNNYNNYINSGGENSLYERADKGFINDLQNGIARRSNDSRKLKRLYAPLSSEIVATKSNEDISNLTLDDHVGVSIDYLNATVRNFNNHHESLKEQLNSSIASHNLASTGSFALYTESPFYYFSWYLYDNGLQTTSGSSGAFMEMMTGNKDSFFYNYDIDSQSSGYGALKDYFDMGSLFHTVIPYLRNANLPMVQWSQIHGTRPYLDVSVKEEDAHLYTDKESESYYKYWHNVNLSRLYNMYTPWVDAMYDTNYAKPEKISYAGEEQIVNDPIDPTSYTIRPMVFSESEMEYYGLSEHNLTTVEQKILKVQRQTREDLFQLLNYYHYDDYVLNSMSAMIMTFNFNKEFSQTNFMDESFVMYPQGFELKNFSYDAYLRLILASSTGESLESTDNSVTIYERIVENTSIFTGILLILGDIVAVYIIPLMKFIFLILTFVLSVITIFILSARAEVSLKQVMWGALMKPLLVFSGITLAHSYIISLFMTNGATGVTGETGTVISLGDPAITLIALLIINIVIVLAYGVVIFGLGKQLFTYGKLTYNVVGGVVASTVTYGTNKFKDLADGGFGFGGGLSSTKTTSTSSYSTDPKQRGINNVEPDSVLEADLRSQQYNEESYQTESTTQSRTREDIDEMLKRGKQNLDGKGESPNLDGDALDDRLDKEAERKRKADEVVDKYDLD